MFERRLKLLLVLTGLATLIVGGRLFQLQVVDASYYRARAERSLLSRPKSLPFVRGSLLDRTGALLVGDRACWDVTLDFEAVAADMGDYRRSFLNRLRRWYRSPAGDEAISDEALKSRFQESLKPMWLDLAALDPRRESVERLRERVAHIYRRIIRIRETVADRRGFDSPVAEERTAHAIVKRLDSVAQIAARERLAQYPWLHVESSSVRQFAERGDAFAHLLGRTGAVTAEVVAADPHADDRLVRYLANDRVGISGAEYAAESLLRGRRGQIRRDRDGRIVADGLIESQDGKAVRLAVHGLLQRRLYDLLARTVDRHPDSSGGAIVVLDVASREVLGLVSYPGYDPNRFDELFREMRDDTVRLPLRFRAVGNGYAPGSTVKPLVCLTGLASGAITLDSQEYCMGYLFPDVRKAWRCWPVRGTGMRMQHGSVDVVEALKGSCNIFMYRLGEKLGVDRLCGAFHSVGVGLSGGTGLKEEATGLNPLPAWLMERRGVGVTPGTARLFAVGQGELLLTPLQVANLMATYASGRYRQVSLFLGGAPRPEWSLPAQPAHLNAVRRGMYAVVNDPEGTAYRSAHFVHPLYAICGKTGSATAGQRPTSYRVAYVGGDGVASVEVVPAGSRSEAVGRFEQMYPDATFDPAGLEVASRWPLSERPAEGGKYSHAWFGGFLQRLDHEGQPDWTVSPRVAFAVLVEFGGSGGRTSGPLAKDVAQTLLELFGEDLDWDIDASREWES